jgi:hypothetical protein
MPGYTLTQHARDQMRRRGVTDEDVEMALQHEISRDAGEPGTIWIRGHAVGGRILKVCVTMSDTDPVIITVAWPDVRGRRQ